MVIALYGTHEFVQRIIPTLDQPIFRITRVVRLHAVGRMWRTQRRGSPAACGVTTNYTAAVAAWEHCLFRIRALEHTP